MQSLVDEQASAYAFMDKYGQNMDSSYVVPRNTPMSLLVEDQGLASPSSGQSGGSSILQDEDGNPVELSFLKGKLVWPRPYFARLVHVIPVINVSWLLDHAIF